MVPKGSASIVTRALHLEQCSYWSSSFSFNLINLRQAGPSYPNNILCHIKLNFHHLLWPKLFCLWFYDALCHRWQNAALSRYIWFGNIQKAHIDNNNNSCSDLYFPSSFSHVYMYVFPLQEQHHLGCFVHCNRLSMCTGFKQPASLPGRCELLLEP